MPWLAYLVHPSSNRVYGADAPRLGVGELRALAALCQLDVGEVVQREIGGVAYVCLDVREVTDTLLNVVSNASSMFALFRIEGDLAAPLLHPVPVSRLDRWDDDLLTIQRYVGKTNEQLTRLLVNLAAAAASGAEAFRGNKLRVLDPLCGRGTTLNQCVVYGYDACGVDVDKRDVQAFDTFFLQWLKDKRAKHETHRESIRLGDRSSSKLTVEFAPNKNEQRAGNVQRVVTAVADTGSADRLFRQVDAIATDLPYGVQHGSRTTDVVSRSPRDLLERAVPSWMRALRSGGGIAVSWNVNTLPRDVLVAALTAAGATVLHDVEGSRGGFSHRVDRAVVRDVVVARKQ